MIGALLRVGGFVALFGWALAGSTVGLLMFMAVLIAFRRLDA